MAIYLIPAAGTGAENDPRRPDAVFSAEWTGIDVGNLPLFIVRTTADAALDVQPGVVRLRPRSTTPLGAQAAKRLQAFWNNHGLPNIWIAGVTNQRQLLRILCQVAFHLQRKTQGDNKSIATAIAEATPDFRDAALATPFGDWELED